MIGALTDPILEQAGIELKSIEPLFMVWTLIFLTFDFSYVFFKFVSVLEEDAWNPNSSKPPVEASFLKLFALERLSSTDM